MSGSLSVFKIINFDKNKMMKKEINSNPQRELNEFMDLHLPDNLGQVRSILHFRNYDSENDRILYNVVHYTDTIKNPIRIYLDSIEDTFSGIDQKKIAAIPKGEKVVVNAGLVFPILADLLFLTFRYKVYSIFSGFRN